jgi:hypothetical protein
VQSEASTFHVGKSPAAARVFRETISLDPMHERAHAMLALSLCSLRRPQDALGAAETALRRWGDDPRPVLAHLSGRQRRAGVWRWLPRGAVAQVIPLIP